MFKKLLFLTFLYTMIYNIIPLHSLAEINNKTIQKTIGETARQHDDRNKSNKLFTIDSQSSVSSRIKQEEQMQKQKEKGYIIKLKNNLSQKQVSQLLAKYDHKKLGKDRIVYLQDKQVVDELVESGQVEYSEPDQIHVLSKVPNDSLYNNQWNLEMLNMPEAWDSSIGSDTVRVGIIDSGLNYAHPEILAYNTVYMGWNYIFDRQNDYDSNGHGTNVTGIIAAATNNNTGIAGVNWNVSIVPLNCFDSNGNGYASDIIEAIYDAVDIFDCKIINISSGGTQYLKEYEEAVNYAASKGVIVIAAVGNAGSSTINYPAGFDNVIGVGSIDSSKQRSYFSQHNSSVFVTAPGEGIQTLGDPEKQDNRYYPYVLGTSFSAPHVTGLAALIASIKPDLTVEDFKHVLKATSEDLGNNGYDTEYGYGLINARAALNYVINQESVEREFPLILSSMPVNHGDTNQCVISLRCDNYTQMEQKGKLIIAAYNQDQLVKVYTEDISIAKLDIYQKEIFFDVLTTEIKAFVLKDYLTPLAKSLMID